jgi:hypothetical protein
MEYKYTFTIRTNDGSVCSFTNKFSEKKDPDTLASELVKFGFLHFVKDNKLTIVNMANVASITVIGEFA